MTLLVTVSKWSLSYLDLYYPGISIVRTAQISLVNDKHKVVAVYLVVGLFILLIITTTLLLGDNAFLQPRRGNTNVLW